MSKKSKNLRWTEEQALAAADRLGQGEKVRKVLETPTLAQALQKLGLNVEGPKPGSKTLAAQEPRETTTGKEPKPKTASKKKAGEQVLDQPPTGNQVRDTAPNKKARGRKTSAEDSISRQVQQAQKAKPAKKRRGVETTPIFNALKNSPARCRWGHDWLAMDFPGGRLLSYNELYSILQYRKYEAFRFKKICREVIEKALKNPEAGYGPETTPRPYFDGPTRLTLVRVGAKGMDREALTVIFKYMTDALRAQGVIEDDNPNIIVEIQTCQTTGPERLAMRLDRVKNWKDPGVPQWEDWT